MNSKVCFQTYETEDTSKRKEMHLVQPENYFEWHLNNQALIAEKMLATDIQSFQKTLFAWEKQYKEQW